MKDLAELHGWYNNSFASFSRAAKALFDEGQLERQWDGNGRFGRYLYRRIDPNAEPDSRWERAADFGA